MTAIDIILARLCTEEGFRMLPYDDKTDKVVKAPLGNITIGYGTNISAGWSQGLARVVLQYQLVTLMTQLMKYPWFAGLDENRASVFLDVGFNDGLEGLLHFPKCIAAAARKDWNTAGAELLDSDAARELPQRYNPLAHILISGVLT